MNCEQSISTSKSSSMVQYFKRIEVVSKNANSILNKKQQSASFTINITNSVGTAVKNKKNEMNKGSQEGQKRSKRESVKKKKNPRPSSSSSPTVHVEINSFNSFLQTFIHDDGSSLRTKKFKVYKPKSSANIIPSSTKRICFQSSGKDIYNTTCTRVKEHTEDTTALSSNIHQQRMISLDGLMVLPDHKVIKNAYLHLDSTKEQFDQGPLGYEKKLRDEIFDMKNDSTNTTEENLLLQTYLKRVKISCAKCLLDIEPNGFVCILSPSRASIDHVIKLANLRKQDKVQSNIKLHADHAEYLLSISVGILKDVYFTAKDAKKKGKKVIDYSKTCSSHVSNPDSKEELQMKKIKDMAKEQNVSFDDGAIIQIKFGHHLSSVLHMLTNEINTSHTMMVMMTQTQKQDTNGNEIVTWELDISGGKRYLGEDSIHCAIRETEEETSLLMDQSWFQVKKKDEPNIYVKKSTKQNMNQYFFIEPPPDLMMDSIINDAFWTKYENK